MKYLLLCVLVVSSGCVVRRDWRGLIGGEIAIASLAPPPVVDVVIVQPRRHARADCPTSGWVVAGDGTRYECPDCEPAPDSLAPKADSPSEKRYRKLLFPRRRLAIPEEAD